MEMCLEEALKAYAAGEVPVGAVVVSPENEVIGRGHNLTVSRHSPLAHAELLALGEAAWAMENHRLIDCTLFVSKEPCLMCAGAIQEARIKRVVFGCFDARRGALGSACDANTLPSNHRIEVQGGLLAERCGDLLREFFRARRDTEAVVTGPTRNRLFA